MSERKLLVFISHSSSDTSYIRVLEEQLRQSLSIPLFGPDQIYFERLKQIRGMYLTVEDLIKKLGPLSPDQVQVLTLFKAKLGSAYRAIKSILALGKDVDGGYKGYLGLISERIFGRAPPVCTDSSHGFAFPAVNQLSRADYLFDLETGNGF